MLNRRHIRTIVVQSIYSNLVEPINPENYKNFVKDNSSNAIDLLFCIIDFLKEINTYFINLESDKFSCPYISKNPYFFFFSKLDLSNFNRGTIINWDNNLNYIIDLQNEFINLDKEYNDSNIPQENNYLDFFIDSYTSIIANSDLLYDFFEDQNINWINDLPYINSFLVKNIQKVNVQNPNSFLLPSLIDSKEEIVFGQDLFMKIVTNDSILKSYLTGRTPNWDTERIAKIDNAILITSIAELIYFDSIPVKVTINEYLEIAKEFSSPSSSKFINGILDNLIRDLTEKGIIVKKGRGLVT